MQTGLEPKVYWVGSIHRPSFMSCAGQCSQTTVHVSRSSLPWYVIYFKEMIVLPIYRISGNIFSNTIQLNLDSSKSHESIFRFLRSHFKVPISFVIYSMQIKLHASIFSHSKFSVPRCHFPVPIPVFTR